MPALATAESPSPVHAPARCPRCDYDLSALPPTWEEMCPVRGVCSECGLDIEWGDVLVKERVIPRWSVDHPVTPLSLSAPATAWRAATTRTLWQGLRLDHPVRVRAWLFACAGALVVFQLWQGMLGYAIEIINPLGFTPGGPYRYPFLGLWPWIVPQFAHSGAVPRWVILMATFAPLVLAMLSDTRRGAKVSWRHAVRIGASGFLAAILILILTSLLDAVATWWLYRTPYNAPSARTAQLIQMSVHGLLSPALGGGCIALLWTSAVRSHLRLPRPGAVSSLVLILSAFAALVVSMTIQYSLNP